MTRRILITNDDGIAAPGLHWLARAAARRGFDVVVAAPSEEASGTSAAMTAVERGGQVMVEEHRLDLAPDVPAYGIAGSPGFIALIALHDAFGPAPDVVLSGVNRGANAGHAVLHSGTVGAALTAAAYGCPAMAVSLDVLSAVEATMGSGGAAAAGANRGRDADRHWACAAQIALELLPRLIAAPPGCVFNVNVPDLPYHRLAGVRHGRLARFGQVQMTVAEAGQGYLRTSLEERNDPVEPGTDLAWLAAGCVSVTAIRGIVEAADVDLSDLNRANDPDHRAGQDPPDVTERDLSDSTAAG